MSRLYALPVSFLDVGDDLVEVEALGVLVGSFAVDADGEDPSVSGLEQYPVDVAAEVFQDARWVSIARFMSPQGTQYSIATLALMAKTPFDVLFGRGGRRLVGA